MILTFTTFKMSGVIMRYYLYPLAGKFENTVCGTRSCSYFFFLLRNQIIGIINGFYHMVLATLCSAMQCHRRFVRNVQETQDTVSEEPGNKTCFKQKFCGKLIKHLNVSNGTMKYLLQGVCCVSLLTACTNFGKSYVHYHSSYHLPLWP